MRLAALAAATAIVAASPTASGVGFLQAHQLESGGFAEAGNPAYPQLTAWAVLGLRATGANPNGATARYLVQHEPELTSATGLALVVLAENALGQTADRPLGRLRALQRSSGSLVRPVPAAGAGRPVQPTRTTRPPSSRRFVPPESPAARSDARCSSCSASATATAASS
jgi:hypothetical protein